MPTARSRLGVAALGDRIYAVGGQRSFYDGLIDQLLGVVEAYDPVANTWTTRARVSARTALGVAALDGRLYAVGGYTKLPARYNPGYRVADAVDVYDPAADRWDARAPLPTPRADLGVAALDGRLYAVGGVTTDGDGNVITPTGMVEAYDPASHTWTPRADLPAPQWNLRVAALDGKLYTVGSAGIVSAYDPATDTWTPRASMPSPRRGFGLAALNQKLYVVGGSPAIRPQG